MLYLLYRVIEEYNLNNSYYETLDENFKQALNLCENNYSHSELLEFLQSGNIVQKQLSALKLETINSQNEAQILVSNLVGQDGKIREAVSLRLNEFMSNPKTLGYFETPENYQIFLAAIIDINGNICRNVIGAISHLKNNANFCNQFCQIILEIRINLFRSDLIFQRLHGARIHSCNQTDDIQAMSIPVMYQNAAVLCMDFYLQYKPIPQQCFLNGGFQFPFKCICTAAKPDSAGFVINDFAIHGIITSFLLQMQLLLRCLPVQLLPLHHSKYQMLHPSCSGRLPLHRSGASCPLPDR